jgi:hypothetical protein
MSRRTNLIIAAIFLVLLAIPVAYIALTWSPKNPFRVRLISMEMPEEQDPFKAMTMHMEVENTSSVSIHFGDAAFRARRKDGAKSAPIFQRILLYSQDDPDRWMYTIAPHSRRRFSAEVTDYDHATVDLDSAEMVYLYESHTKRRIVELLSRALEYGPDWFKEHLPEIFSDSDQSAAAIEPPSNSLEAKSPRQ